MGADVMATPTALESLDLEIQTQTWRHPSNQSFCLLDWLSQSFPALRVFHLSCDSDCISSLTNPCSTPASPRPPLTELTLQGCSFAPEWLTSFPSLTSLSIDFSQNLGLISSSILAVLSDLGRHLPVLHSLCLTYHKAEVEVMPFLSEWSHTMRHLHTLSLVEHYSMTTAELWNLLTCFADARDCWPGLRMVEIHTHWFSIDQNARPGSVLSLLPTIDRISLLAWSGWSDPNVKRQILNFLSASKCVVDCGVSQHKPTECVIYF
eukprot:TRINITY_DN6114_c0_g1_i3.p1 TRINITY_DN6114_c0_g1~~TRINITY_DN6114_c0_g1_i3.p1  ORF type:complete len:272 (+),score=26.68 TRINITY_DN6114_c0_g1_i3:26-817(+)